MESMASGLGGAVFNYNGTVSLSSNQFLNNVSSDGLDIYNLGDSNTASLTFLTNLLNSFSGTQHQHRHILCRERDQRRFLPNHRQRQYRRQPRLSVD